MKELKNRPALCNDMTRLFKSISRDGTRRMLQGAYQEKNFLVSTNGHTLFYTSRTGTFGSVTDGKIIDLLPIEKSINFDMFKTYSLTIDREYPKFQNVIPAKFSKKTQIILPNWIEKLAKCKENCLLYFDGVGFSINKPEKIEFCLDARLLSNVLPNETNNFWVHWNNDLLPVCITDTEQVPSVGDFCSWVFLISPIKL